MYFSNTGCRDKGEERGFYFWNSPNQGQNFLNFTNNKTAEKSSFRVEVTNSKEVILAKQKTLVSVDHYR